VQVPFTDNSDKGDLRFDYQINPSSSFFLRISDRKENGVNYPTIPVPLDGQTNGKIRILDQQIALGYTQLFGANKVLDARIGLDRTKAGKYNLSIGNTAFNNIPGLPTGNAVVAGGLPSIQHLRRLYRLRPAEHQPAVAGPRAARSQGELHLGEGQALAEVRL
jgi:hypothetical protein